MRDWLAMRADATPDAAALAGAGDLDTARSYAQLNDRVEVLAGRLAASGVGVDDSVAVCAETSASFVELAHAAQRLGAILVPVSPRLTERELARRLDSVDPVTVVCEPATATAVAAATDPPVRLVGDSETDVDTAPRTNGDGDPETSAESLEAVEPEPFDLPEWELDDPMVVTFTSGTTGAPKGVVLTMANVLASATASAFRLGLRRDDCWHVALPMSHMGGLAPVYRSTLYGTTLAVQRDFEPEATLDVLRDADATCTSLVPTMLDRLLEVGPFPDLRFVLLGGAACPPDLLERARERDVPVAPTYGMTEAASQVATALPGETDAHPESVGNPVMFAEVLVVDDTGARCDRGEPGELVVNGPMVTTGYLDKTETAEAFCNAGFRTGDRGYRDEAGRVYVLGRVDDTIVTGGENVDPAEVAAVLGDHPAVADCAVVGLPDDEWGERVAALVAVAEDAEGDVSAAGAAGVSAAALREHCRERLAGFKLPRSIELTDAVPRTASGTVDREAVEAQLLDDAEE